jgi:hypothetical protein
MKGFITTIMVLVLVSACGTYNPKDDSALKDKNEKDTADKQDVAERYPDGVTFAGYLSPAFSITVDGVRYADSEDFYTQQIDKLAKDAKADGYAGWTLDFDAQIGLDDLKYGMKVYIAAASGRGYAAETIIAEDGTFAVQFPKEAVDSVYQVRANKHISVSLTNPADETGNDSVRWCYNFSAVDQSVSLSDHDKPIILNSFVTRVTKYECSASSNGGISIPQDLQRKVKKVVDDTLVDESANDARNTTEE